MKIYQGVIITCDNESRIHRYLVEDQGKILYVGDELPGEYASAPLENLGVKALVPSFGDTHIHFASFALFNAGLDVRSARNIQEMQENIRKLAVEKKDPIIMGFGASTHSVEEKRLISKNELDEVSPDRAVFIVKYDGHACILNSKMISMMPKKIRHMRGYNEETGEMRQEAFFASTNYITGKVSLLKSIGNLLSAVDTMAEKGIGMMHTVSGIGYFMDLDVNLEVAFGRGLNSGFQTRVFFQTMDISKVKRRNLPRVGGCFETALDGCFGSEDAAMNLPYNNNPDNRGILFYTDEQVVNFVKQANREGLQIELHAIGDAAFNQAVMAIEVALKDFPREDHRHGIIHACLPTEEGLLKCAELGIHLPVQPAFLDWNLEPEEYLESIIGDRVKKISPLRDMTDMGIILSGGSDGPCTIPDPIFGMYCACNHYVPEQSLSIAEALKMFTYNTAWTCFDEKERGSLEAGKIADMVILNRNPMAMDPKALTELKVEKLILGGKPYEKGQGILSLLAKAFLNGGSV